MAHAHVPPRRLAHHGERLGQDVIHILAVGQARAELRRLVAELLVVQRLDLRLQLVDLVDDGLQLLDRLLVAIAEEL